MPATKVPCRQACTTGTLARPVELSRDWSNVLLGKVGVVNCYRAIDQSYHDLRAAARTIP